MKSNELFEELYAQIKVNKGPFLVVFFIIVLITYGLLFALDFYPEPREADASERTEEMVTNEEEITEPAEVQDTVIEEDPLASLPTSIYFDTLNREVPVLNPSSNDVAELDAALLSGAVRHPDSADLSTKGNMFILAHSSYLPTVFNKNFQAFNGIQDLVWGDTIRVRSVDAEYIYRVQKVYQGKASEVAVPATPGKAQLALATCNSFGSKDDRFVVEATLIETKKL